MYNYTQFRTSITEAHKREDQPGGTRLVERDIISKGTKCPYPFSPRQ